MTTRRRFIEYTAALAAALGTQHAGAQPPDPPKGPGKGEDKGKGKGETKGTGKGGGNQPGRMVLRRSIGSMALNDPALESYRKAVKAMKALPASDPRSWVAQANIHQNFCPHGNWYFLPWHRAYLVAFERICQDLSGDPDFGLPYWDWTSNRQLPAAFTAATYLGQPNPLFEPRTMTPAASLPDNMVGPVVISNILAEPSFEVFASARPNGQNNNNAATWQRAPGVYGPLESNPHNRIHGTVGGIMGSFQSPRDPIFWLHHCNIDRLWQEWNEAGGVNTNDNLWLNFDFDGNFVKPDQSPYNAKVAALRNITALLYRYKLRAAPKFAMEVLALQRVPKPKPIGLDKVLAANAVPVAARGKMNTRLDMAVTLTQPEAAAVRSIKPPDTSSPEPTLPVAAARAVAVIGDVEAPKSGNAEVRVFVNCDYLAPDTPTTDPSYVGTFSFFGGDHAGAGHASHASKLSFFFDLTPAVINLKRQNKDPGGKVTVQLMPVPIAGGPKDVDFKPGNVRVAVL
jgi:tyrosinase